MPSFPERAELERLYCTEGRSVCWLTARFRLGRLAINRLLDSYGIKRRSRIDAVIRSRRKYEKPSFSGSYTEKAYLLGLSQADFRVRRHGYQIDVALSTTHPAFARLFLELFSKFAPVSERAYYNRTTGRYGWRLAVYLHPSFDFLLGPKQVSREISSSTENFLHFLAGYSDGEGTISIGRNSPRCVAFVWAVASSDKSILTSIYRGLVRLGFHPYFGKSQEAGTANRMGNLALHYRKPRWVVRLKRKAEVIKLLSLLPLRHPEKIEKRKVMFDLRTKCYISDTLPQWRNLRDEITTSVDVYLFSAALERLAPEISALV